MLTSWTQALFSQENQKKNLPLEVIAPFSILIASLFAPLPPFFLAMGCIGIFLSSFWEIRGFCYSLVFLAIGGAILHLFKEGHQIAFLTVEGVYGLSFLIAALVAEERGKQKLSSSALLEAKEASIAHLEETLTKEREEGVEAHHIFEQKCLGLQKEIEEMQTESSSLSVLNEVLRKNGAVHLAQIRQMKEEIFDLVHQKEGVLETNTRFKQEIEALRGEPLALEAQALRKELNELRVAKEQMKLIGEAIAKEHIKEQESSKSKTARIEAMEKELQILRVYKNEVEILQDKLVQLDRERTAHLAMREKLEKVQQERNHLQERVEKADLSRNLSSLEEVQLLKERCQKLSSIEALYKQLKTQFAEKDQILAETRKELFHQQTELASVLMEKEERKLNQDVLKSQIEEELLRLEQENQELEAIISNLTKGS